MYSSTSCLLLHNVLQNLGADFRYDEERGIYEITADRLQGSYMLLDEASVTGTANIVMAAVLANNGVYAPLKPNSYRLNATANVLSSRA